MSERNTNARPNRAADITYPYEDKDGNTVFEIKRWGDGEGKAFQAGRFENDYLVETLDNIEHIPYRLPQLLNAPKTKRFFIVEGEKDEYTMRQMGEIATTNPFGGEHWLDEYNWIFENRDVILVEDNDLSGRKRSKAIYNSLKGIVKSISIIRFTEMQEKSDVTDYISSGKTSDDLFKKIQPAIDGIDFDRKPPSKADLKENPKAVGSIENSAANVELALEKLRITLRRDSFSLNDIVSGLPKNFKEILDDDGAVYIKNEIYKNFKFKVPKEDYHDHLSLIAKKNEFHPVKEYLDNLVWDGTPRIDNWLTTYAGVETSEYVRAISSIVLMAGVERIRNPGCKFDELLILEGPQGLDKSTALRILAVKDEWFTDSVDLSNSAKEFIEQTKGIWIAEIAELGGLNKPGVDKVKAFLSRQVDIARMSYGRYTLRSERQMIPIGSYNPDKNGYLRDITGNRRFWPVTIGKRFDIPALKKDRDQLWAEAAHRQAKGESIRLDARLYDSAEIEQVKRREKDSFEDLLQIALEKMEGRIAVNDVYTLLNISPGQITNTIGQRVGESMKAIGWEKKTIRFKSQDKLVKGYEKGDSRKEILVSATNEKKLGTAYYFGEEPF